MAFNATTTSSFHPAGKPTKVSPRANDLLIHKSKNIEQAYKTMSVSLRPNN